VLKGADFLEIVSGRRRGVVAGIYRAAFCGAEILYTLGIHWRNHGFDRGWRTVYRVTVPVISVGNLTVGGTGKTPFVQWLAEWYRRHDIRVVIISRGYGAEAGARNDEAMELEKKLPDVPHLQNPDRVAAAETAIEEFESQIVLLDDAFQHRRIHRELDIVLIDALEPFGFDHLLPRGLLREPINSLRRADVVALSRCNLVGNERREQIVQQVRRKAPDATIVEVQHQPSGWVQSSGQRAPLETLRGERVAAFCGIGNPGGFEKTLDRCGVELVAFRAFPDHHLFRSDDLQALARWAQESGAAAAVCTVKDLVKIQVNELQQLPLWSLEIGIEFASGQVQLERRLSEFV
jgi:tetraacyldisaccharide 4'-kinase